MNIAGLVYLIYLNSKMIHTYNISGMTCDGCRTKVEKTLNAIDGVAAEVSLNPPIATITM